MKRLLCMLLGHDWDRRSDLMRKCHRCGKWALRYGVVNDRW